MSFSPALIKALTNLGKKEVAKPLAEAFGGLAESATNGALDKLNEFIASASSPAMAQVTAQLTASLTPERIELMQQFNDLLKDPDVQESIQLLIDTLKDLLPAITQILPPLIKLTAQILNLTARVGDLDAAITTVSDALTLVTQYTKAWSEILDYLNSEDFRSRSERAWASLKDSFNGFIVWISDLDGALKDIGNAFQWVRDKFQELKDINPQEWFDNFVGGLQSFWDAFVEGFSR